MITHSLQALNHDYTPKLSFQTQNPLRARGTMDEMLANQCSNRRHGFIDILLNTTSPGTGK